MFLGCGDDVVGMDMMPPDLSMPDLVKPVDLSKPDFAGVACGQTTCGSGQDCCVQLVSGAAVEMCMPTGTCQADAGVALMCDGPEDCTTSMPECCITASGMGSAGDGGAMGSGSGDSACVTKCVAVINANASGMFTAHTRMCHTNDDCTNLTGTVNSPLGQMQNVAFAKCCSTPMTGTLEICLPSFATQLGATCQ